MSEGGGLDQTRRDEQAIARVAGASRSDRVWSQVGWWSPEVVGATAVAGVGAATLHPAAAVAAYALVGARIGWAALRRHRGWSGSEANADAEAGEAEASTSSAGEVTELTEGVS